MSSSGPQVVLEHKTLLVPKTVMEGWLYKAGAGLQKKKLKKRWFSITAGTGKMVYGTTVGLIAQIGMAEISTQKGTIDLSTVTKLVEGFHGQFCVITPTRAFDLHIERPDKASKAGYEELMYSVSSSWLTFLAKETGVAVSGNEASPSGFSKVTRRESIALIKDIGGVLPGGGGAAEAAAAAGRRRSIQAMDAVTEGDGEEEGDAVPTEDAGAAPIEDAVVLEGAAPAAAPVAAAAP